ncbi:MAG: MarR family transcriptional regulator [Mycobacteriaceae bacterium]|nr:MarR family transcriptional regulator [Mycobacteriaceae bacterium]
MIRTDAPLTVDQRAVAAVRAFNRNYTRTIGVLGDGLLGTAYSLTEARILFELAAVAAADVVDLRRSLGLDAGYMSRILNRFEDKGLVARTRSDIDGRKQVVTLTDAGRTVFAELDDLSRTDAAKLLEPHSPITRARLVEAMHTIERILDRPADAPAVVLRDPRPGDYGWVIQRNAVLYAQQFGWNADYEHLVTRIVAEFLNSHDPQREHAWIAEYDGVPVGSVFCVTEDDRTARLRLLLVEPTARGVGVGSALVDQCLRFARQSGYAEMVLWTNDCLESARHIYERAGFELTESNPHRSFGVDLVGQTWRLPL